MPEKLKLIIGMLEEELKLLKLEDDKPYPSASNIAASRARLRTITQLMITTFTEYELSLVRRVEK